MNHNFQKMILLTLLLDVFLVYLMIFRTLHKNDTHIIFLFLFCHAVLLYSLFTNNEVIINILHYLLCILLFATTFLIQDVFLLMVLLFLVFMIQFLWIIEDKCIMNKDDKNMFENEYITNGIRVITLLLTMYLSFRIGKCINKVI